MRFSPITVNFIRKANWVVVTVTQRRPVQLQNHIHRIYESGPGHTFTNGISRVLPIPKPNP